MPTKPTCSGERTGQANRDPSNASEGSTRMLRVHELRAVMRTILRTDADFDAFCLDYFPEAFHNFSEGMSRTKKENLLFKSVAIDCQVLTEALFKKDPVQFKQGVNLLGSSGEYVGQRLPTPRRLRTRWSRWKHRAEWMLIGIGLLRVLEMLTSIRESLNAVINNIQLGMRNAWISVKTISWLGVSIFAMGGCGIVLLFFILNRSPGDTAASSLFEHTPRRDAVYVQPYVPSRDASPIIEDMHVTAIEPQQSLDMSARRRLKSWSGQGVRSQPMQDNTDMSSIQIKDFSTTIVEYDLRKNDCVVVAEIVMNNQREFNPLPRLPETVKSEWMCTKFTLRYKLFVATDGQVVNVEPIKTIYRADSEIRRTLLTWRFKSQANFVCYYQHLYYEVNDIDSERSCNAQKTEVEIRDWSESERLQHQLVHNGPAPELIGKGIRAPTPNSIVRLLDDLTVVTDSEDTEVHARYRVCVATGGYVYDVKLLQMSDPRFSQEMRDIMNSDISKLIYKRQYRPLPQPRCFEHAETFVAERRLMRPGINWRP